ncbi:HMA2 domain-containing protein [Tolypothrix sp. FACHB-123]|uniref:HMA2 domain-containing protein n=1 Tax=Tolypothrix sp. FACHB-123 TaxID=2692868 RepID=UPI001F5537D7|nr:hypothetical protein [Tolypothrix sp. FACHB-123]
MPNALCPFSTKTMVIIPQKQQISHPALADTPIATQIISDTPGRLRLRIAPSHRQSEIMQQIVNFLETQPYIIQVKTNLHQGSILINYAENVTLAVVFASLQKFGINFTNYIPRNTKAAIYVRKSVIAVNNKFARATDSTVDLRFLFPLGLSILAVRQLIIKGMQLDMIPWYVLAWYAFDSFLKLNNVNSQNPYSQLNINNKQS